MSRDLLKLLFVFEFIDKLFFQTFKCVYLNALTHDQFGQRFVSADFSVLRS